MAELLKAPSDVGVIDREEQALRNGVFNLVGGEREAGQAGLDGFPGHGGGDFHRDLADARE